MGVTRDKVANAPCYTNDPDVNPGSVDCIAGDAAGDTGNTD